MSRLTDKQKHKISSLVARGLSDEEIAERVGCSRGGVNYYRNSKRKAATPYTPEQDDILNQEMEAPDDRSIMQRVRDICAKTGRTPGSVHGRLFVLGLIKNKDAAPPGALKPWPADAVFTSLRMKPLYSHPALLPPVGGPPSAEARQTAGELRTAGFSIPFQATDNSAPVPGAGLGARQADSPARLPGRHSEVSA